MTAKTKEFMTALIEELTSFNEGTEDDYCSDPLDIPYLVAPLFQSIKKCTDFINCIERHNYNICSYEEDKTGGYTNGRIKVVVYKLDSDGMDYYDSIEDYCYYIEFRQENPSLGMCQCTEEQEDYREDKLCCGHGCDWDAPAFNITKEYDLLWESWEGGEHDFWEFEDGYYGLELKNAKEKEIKDRERKIKELTENIKSMQSELESLKS